MKQITKWLLGASIAVFFAGGALANDFEKGVDAFKAGDDATAQQELNILAMQGDVNAAIVVGQIHFSRKHYSEAASMWLRVAETGNARGQYLTGLAHFNIGSSSSYNSARAVKHFETAFMWFLLAEEQGFSIALDSRSALMREYSHFTGAREYGTFSRAVVRAHVCIEQNYKDC